MSLGVYVWFFCNVDGLVRMMSHRGLPGTDYYDCAYIFFYVLGMTTFKQGYQKLLGTAPAGQGGMFTPPEQ